MSATQIFVLVNFLGGVSVLGSYFLGLKNFPDLREDLWGGISGSLRVFFTLSMLGAAVGYLTFCFIMVFGPLGSAIADSYLQWAFPSLVAIFLFSAAIWMPATIQYLNTANSLWWNLSVFALWTTALSLLILAVLLLFYSPETLDNWVKYIGVIGLGWITFHCLVLDACIWVALFRHP